MSTADAAGDGAKSKAAGMSVETAAGWGEKTCMLELKCPTHQPLLPYTGPRWFGGKTCEFKVPVADFTGALKSFYGFATFKVSAMSVYKSKFNSRAKCWL